MMVGNWKERDPLERLTKRELILTIKRMRNEREVLEDFASIVYRRERARKKFLDKVNKYLGE